MADISKILLSSNNEYNVKDATARANLVNKQDTLISGSNIKTINNNSILGSGNLDISGHVELTQAEYDQLSQAEKENGTVYFISDGEPDYTIINDSVPIGAIQPYAGSTAPYGWLVCDGSAVSRETYSELFTAIGTTYGSGDGSTTFNVPDLKGRTIVGVGESSATGHTNHTLGQSDGAETHNHLYGIQLGAYYQTAVFEGLTDAGLLENGDGTPQTFGAIKYVSGNKNNGLQTNTSSVSGMAISRSTAHTSSESSMQPYVVTNYIIKAHNHISSSRLEELDPQHILFDMLYPVGSYYETSDSTFDPNEEWTGTWILETAGQVHVSAGTGYTIGSTGGEATHTLTTAEIPSHVHGNSGGWGAGSSGDVYWRIDGNNPANFWGPTFAEGGGQSHNNMQPYIAVNRWHRTA